MAAVYLQMAGAVLVSAAAALLVAYNPALSHILFKPGGLTAIGWIVALAPLALVIVLSGAIDRLSAEAARLLFLLYATLIGLSLGGVFSAYSDVSIGLTFACAAAGFATLAMLGAFARRDLGALGSFLTIALFGTVAALLINLFVGSARFDLVLAGIGVLLFAGLTAFDVQRLRNLHDERPEAAVIGALTLYLDFLNLFLSLLRLSGRGRR